MEPMNNKSGLVETAWDALQQIEGAKRTMYRTAQATIGCAHFKANDFVSVEYFGQNNEGIHYFSCWQPNRNSGVAVYPEHHLTKFCL